MGFYSLYLTFSALITAGAAGFIMARSPRQRSAQLFALVLAGVAWWAFCEGQWNNAAEADDALLWMRLSTPGWAFLSALVPHASARYFLGYPGLVMERRRRLMMRFGWL